MRMLCIPFVALVACETPPEPTVSGATQYIGEDRDTGEPWYPDTSGDGNDGNDSGDNDGQMECRDVTISGRVFYNDLRSTGRFGDRYDPAGNPGTKDAFGGDNRNYLGLRDAVIDFYEVDDTTSGDGCVETSLVGGATINNRGEYTWTGQVCDACDADHDGANDHGVSLAGRIRLRFCNSDRCFSVRDSLNMPTTHDAHFGDTFVADPYRRWLRGASLSSPRIFAAATTAALADDYFQDSASQTAGVPTDLSAQAASVYASLVDTTRVLHYTHDVPYDKDRFGEVQVFYPSVIGDEAGGGAHSHQPELKGTSRLCIESQMDGQGPWIDPPPINKPPYYDPPGYFGVERYLPREPEAWFEGSVVAHEYGHLVHYWQWDGFGKWTSYCYDDPACEEGGAPEYVLAALKEGWATFIQRVVWNGLGNGWGKGCDNIETDSPAGAPYATPPAIASLNTIGRRWFPDVTQALCDIWDASADTAQYGLVSYTDASATPLAEMVAHLEVLWSRPSTDRAEIMSASSFASGEAATTPVGLCEYVRERAGNSAWITALEVSGIECNL